MNFFLFVLFSILSFQASSLFAEPSKIDTWNSPTSLDSKNFGDWEFLESDVLDPSELPKEGWAKVQVPSNLFATQNLAIPKTRVWLKKDFKAPENTPSKSLAILLGYIEDKDETFLNDELIGKTGEWGSDLPFGYDRLRIYEIPLEFLKEGKSNTIKIRMENYFDGYIGILQHESKIGYYSDLIYEIIKESAIYLFAISIYLVFGLFFIFLYLRRRKDSAYLFYGLFSLVLVVYQLLTNQIKSQIPISFYALKKIEYFCLPMLFPFMVHFIRKFFRFPYSKILYPLDAFCIGVFIIYFFIFDIRVMSKIFSYGLQIVWLVYLFLMFYYILKRVSQKNRESYYIFFGFVFVLAGAILDNLSNWHIIQFPKVIAFFFMAFMLMLAIILANRFVRLSQEIEELNRDLEHKVVERTNELQITLNDVKALKVQQDGDYYLTSLLLSPLQKLTIPSDRVRIQTFTKQKKQFEFKTKKYEIGGDIIILDTIRLRNIPYVIFLNGDAMGKSIQGAGGALVMGVIFHTILSRSKLTSTQNKFPEQWLKEAFLEMQSVFVSFDGTMTGSMFLGLLNEENGVLYYINAEHPWAVLCRDGKAVFIEEDLHLRKLGFPGNEKNFGIKLFPLKKGDCLLVGSDGKDDLVLEEKTEDRDRVINMDETLFLNAVENSDGELETIYYNLLDIGGLSDDFSLLSLESVELGVEEKTNLEDSNFKNQALDLVRQNEYQSAIPLFEKWYDENPLSLESLFHISYCYKRLKMLKKSADFGEMVFSRDKNHKNNLLNLTEVYSKLGISEKVQELFKISQELQLEHPILQKVQEKFGIS